MAVLGASAASAQTDVAVSGYEALNRNTAGNGVQQTVSNAPGGMLELRRLQAPWIGYEIAYSLHPEDVTLAPVKGSCGYYCDVPTESVTTKAHEATIDWVGSKQMGRIRPFVVGGFGFTVVVPGTYRQYEMNTSVRMTYVYGGGVDWGLGSRAGVRLQYRGNFYKTPDISFDFPTTGQFTHTAGPMIGVYFHL